MAYKNSILLVEMTLLITCVASFNNIQSVHSAPSDSFTVPCRIDTYGQAWEGYLAFGLFRNFNSTNSSATASYLVVMGTNGELLYSRKSPGWTYNGAVKYMGNDTLMYPQAGTHFWNLKTNVTTDFPNVYGHHDMEYNPVTNTFLTLRAYQRDINGTKVTFDKVVELNDKGEILWTWDTYDYTNLSEACPFCYPGKINGETVLDFTHSNSLQWDYTENIVYLNVRNLNTFYKINKTTGELIWSCGEHGDFTLLDANGKKVPSLWYHSHAVKEVEPNVFIMFDNDYHNITHPFSGNSRILEVTLNEQNMTAWVSWSWAVPREYWSPYWGKADRLPNGDRIGTFGTETHSKYENIFPNSTGAVLLEVNPKGEVVRTYTFPFGWGIYRIEEIGSDWNIIPEFPLDAREVVLAAGLAVSTLAGKIKISRRKFPTLPN